MSIRDFYLPQQLVTTMSSGNAKIGKPAPGFKATAVVDGQFKDVQLSDYKGNGVSSYIAYTTSSTCSCTLQISYLLFYFILLFTAFTVSHMFDQNRRVPYFVLFVLCREVCGLVLLPLGLHICVPH